MFFLIGIILSAFLFVLLVLKLNKFYADRILMIWNRQLWLIDHGASLYFRHGPQDWNEQAKKPFTLI